MLWIGTLVFGLSIWPATDIKLSGKINVNKLAAGYSIDSNRFSYDDRPNKASEVCAVRIYEEYNGYTAVTTLDDDNIEFNSKCLSGHVGCFGSESNLHYYLKYDEIDNNDNECESMKSDSMKLSYWQNSSSNIVTINSLVIYIGGLIVLICIIAITFIIDCRNCRLKHDGLEYQTL